MTVTRMTADDRREQLIDTALVLSAAGLATLTLARVAESAGVSKPIAYRHFASLDGLLLAMYRRIESQFQARMAAVVDAWHDGDGGRGGVRDAAWFAERVSIEYVDCTLANAVLIDQLGAAIVDADGGPAERSAAVARYSTMLVAPLGVDEATALLIATAFVGAADRLCDAVRAGALSRDGVVAVLTRLLLGVAAPAAAPDAAALVTEARR